MPAEIVPFDKDLVSAMSACVEHARDLLESARIVQASGRSNIAFHLGILALEELGRRELLSVKAIEPTNGWADKLFQDHVQKLFWCFFGARLMDERITRETLDGMKGLATRLHQQRLAGLYVNVGVDGLSIPADQIPIEEADRLLSLAQARLEITQASGLREGRTKEEIEVQAWFLSVTRDPERRKFVFSNTSLDKLAELGSPKAWVNWLRQEFEKAESEARALAEAELENGRRIIEHGAGDATTKWKVKIRLYSNSHSVRPKVLNHWNDRVTWIKLVPIPDKKDQLILEIQLGSQVPIQALWYMAWGIARSFVAALNIATMGYWFWRMPIQVNKYYESIEDVVNKTKLILERQPSLKVDWGENRTLATRELDEVISTFICLPGPADTERHAPYAFYLGGLTFLSINDVHWQCESLILGNFLSSHREMMRSIGALAPDQSFADAIGNYIKDFFPDLDEDRERILVLCKAFDQDRLAQEQITLKDATLAKLICDSYFLQKVRPIELERLRQGQTRTHSRLDK